MLFSIKTTDFNLEKAAQSYHLSVEVGNDSFAYAVLDIDSKSYVAMGNQLFSSSDINSVVKELHQIIATHPLLESTFYSTSISFVNSTATLIPNPLFDKEKIPNYLEFNHTIDEEAFFTSDTLSNIEAKTAFCVNNTLFKEVKSFFSTIKVQHFSSVFIDAIVLAAKPNVFQGFVNVRANSFQLAFAKQGTLLYYNSFTFQTDEDIAYYVLFAFNQLKLNREKTSLILSGNNGGLAKTKTLLMDYVLEVDYAEINQFNFQDTIKPYANHQFYTLFNQYLCV